MKKVIIIISHRKLKLGLIFSICLSFFIIIFFSLPTDIISVFNTSSDATIEALEKEQERLKGTLIHLFPDTDKPLYESERTSSPYHEPTTETFSIPHVISDGDPLPFRTVTDAPDYLRPIYDSDWRGFYFRDWIYLPNRIRDARHKLFIFYGGGSNLFDFSGEQSLNIITDIDYHKDINFLVYDFNVQAVKSYKNQIALIGKPQITGVQVIAVSVNDILPKEIDRKDFLFQLTTPRGYEIDYLHGDYIRSEYLKKIDPTFNPMFTANQDNRSIKELQQQNAALKKELAYYIPLNEDIRLTEENCSGRPLEILSNSNPISIDMVEQSIYIPYHTHFSNLEYERPIYHPAWKSNYQSGWAYVPQKICEALHNLFIIPSDDDRQKNLFGNLAFFEKFQPLHESQVGFLVYNWDITGVKIFENKVFIVGTPSRTGGQIISINKKYLDKNQEYIFYLETLDGFLMDVVAPS